MIKLYGWGTPNGRKISIALEELALRYSVTRVDITKDEQFTKEFLSLNPNNKIPVIVDEDGPDGRPITVFESGAILMYLADKTGKLMPESGRAYYRTLQWLMFQMGGVGPMLGQMHHFQRYAREQEYGLKRYGAETRRLYGVLDKQLAHNEFVAGSDYSIADIAVYPWIARFELHQIEWSSVKNVERWYDQLGARGRGKTRYGGFVTNQGSSFTVLGRNTSSNVQKVMWLLAEIGQVCTRVDMGGSYGGNREEAYLKKNPNGVVPTLLHGEETIWESNTILRYISTISFESKLYPARALARAEIERWMDWQLGTFGPVNALLYQSIIRTPEYQRQHDVIEKHRARNAELLGILNNVLSQHKFVAGDEFTLADIAIGPLVHRWFNLPVERPEYGFVRTWYDGLCERKPFVDHVRQIAFV